MTPLCYLGRVASICGNRIALVDVATPIPVGLHIVADDDRQGRTPRAGRTTVVEGPEVTVEDAAAAGIVAGDYIFEAPPTEAELLERRVVALEAAAFPKWARERFAVSVDERPVPPPTVEVEVTGCLGCPVFHRDDHYSFSGRCALAGVAIGVSGETPAGCPLRSGPVALRFVDRGRP